MKCRAQRRIIWTFWKPDASNPELFPHTNSTGMSMCCRAEFADRAAREGAQIFNGFLLQSLFSYPFDSTFGGGNAGTGYL